ncbi:Bug family tripartite tricarboxylate transporter substrate binding protein [Variovorax sp.]|jgi:tripartite-type tricarboxylate transporter receptor subunit TctC|uniref:Bug family tripartite tricarboxylate transporter substrate binding protein n=1 Tax=Variovorax sp. TaxID=1871043 RepID=UPI001215310E|nr:tripartite tricarboxylate transporter substrate-binding protein [Variovorax sp.]TAJ65714.1 MAG: tripartite tricarboxylate transporter substrate binding protein [Variovorax sp.]
MPSFIRRSLAVAAFAACVLPAAHAQLPPGLAGGNLRIVVGYAAGGAADTVARLYAEQLKDAGFGSIVVDNKPGASARLAWDTVKKAKPDGLTLYLAPSPLLTILPLTYKTPGYDADKDLVPVALLVEIPTAVVTGAGQPYSSMKQYVEWAKKNPSKATLGLATIGSSGHLGAFALAKAQGFDLTPVAYRGASPMLIDVVGGELSMGWDAAASMMPLYKGGKIKFLGLSGDKRLPALPDVPTAKEQGFGEFVAATSWYAVYAPAGTPAAALSALERGFLAAAAKPGLARSLEAAGLVAHAEGRAELAQRAQRERRNWEPIVKAAGIVIDE